MLNMLDGYASQMSGFRSTKTGLSFDDLKIYFSSIKDTEYAKLYAIVRAGCLSKNKEVLLKNYQYKVEQLQISNNKKAEESKLSFEIMTNFYKQYQHAVTYNNWQNGQGSNNNNIIYDETIAKKMTTYDEIMTYYVDSGVEAENAGKDIEYYNQLINDYQNSKFTPEQEAASKKEADLLIKKIDESLKECISIANETLNDYNVYKGTNYISYLTSVSVDAKLSKTVILAFAVMAGAFLGIIIAICIEVIKRLMEEEKLKDKRKKMQLLEKGVLPKDMDNMPPLDRALFEAVSDELKEFYLMYQPIVDNRGKWAGAEAFVRWGSKEFGTIMPNEFIEIAEKYDIMEILGKWILREACAKCKTWNKNLDANFFISVNFTFKQVTSRIFMDEILDALNEVKLNSKNLVLEVSSGIGTENAEVIEKKLSAIKTFGVGIAIDDLNNDTDIDDLADMPIDFIKASQEYIEENDVVLAGKRYDFKVNAQMVETAESYAKLSNMGVDYMQGYYFSKPLPEDQFIEEYKKRM